MPYSAPPTIDPALILEARRAAARAVFETAIGGEHHWSLDTMAEAAKVLLAWPAFMKEHKK